MLARIGVRLRQFFDDHHHEDLADEVWTVVVRALILCSAATRLGRIVE
jgi:hypothetical protein